jgi:hypothetical protein
MSALRTSTISPLNMMPGGIGELSFTLWLLITDVDVEHWHEQAVLASTSQELAAKIAALQHPLRESADGTQFS